MALDRLTIITSSGLSTVSDYVIDGLRAVGVVTASTVQVGAATTVHTTGVDLGSGNITSHNINSTGIITATGIDVKGVLSYEDVTNVDSVGLGTFRNGLHVIDGSVGIGTDNPRTNFQVGAFGSGSDSNIQLATGTSGASNILFGDGSGGTDWYKGFIKYNHSTDNLELYSADDIIHYTSGTERLHITSAGNIGINNTSPGTKLAIGGSTIDSSNVLTFGKRVAGSNSNLPVIGHHSDGSGSGIAICATSTDGKIHFFTGNGSAGFGDGSNAERLRITAAGSVGIGTITPGAKLEVFDETSNTILNVKSGDSGAVLNLIDDSARSSIEQNGTTLKISSDTGAEYAGSDIRLQVDGASKMIIRDSGDVVTGVPSHDLQSNTGSRTVFTVADTTNGALVHIRGQSPAAFFDVSNGGIGKVFLDGANFAIQSGTPASEGNERLRINGDGRVSIGGVTSPLGALHIEANQGTDTALWIGDNSSSRYLAINEQSSSSSFNNITTRYNDNSIHAHYILDNPYAQGTGYGSQILFRGNNQATTAYIETSNEASGSARGTLRLRGADHHGLDVKSTGEVTTTHASNIGYETNAATNTRSLVYQSRDPQRQEPVASDWYILKSFYPNKSGRVNMHAEMYIASGTYYFSFRVREEGTNTIVFNAGDNGGFGAYATNGNAVHSYRIYKWICPKIKAHKRYYIEMAATNAAGTAGPYTSVGQWLYLKNFSVYSMSGGHSDGTEAIQIGQPHDVSSAQANSGTTHFYISPGVNRDSINVTQYFAGTESTFLGWFTSRAYNRYIDFELNMSGSYMWFAQAYGYLYSRGQVAGSMISGYTYTNNQILNKYSLTLGNRGWYGSYRTSSGNLCLKFDSGGNGYSEGKIALFIGTHGPTPPEWRVLQYRQNDTTNNIF